MAEHGIRVVQQATNVNTPAVAKSAVAFVIGAAPVQSAKDPVEAGSPVLCTCWKEAVERLGYSDDWKSYDLCEFMYSHFKLSNCQPVIFCNLLDPADMRTPIAAADLGVVGHCVKLPIGAIDDTLSVKKAGGTGDPLRKGTDYETFYSGEQLVVALLADGAGYDASAVQVAYDRVDTTAITAAVVAAGLESIEKCLTTVGITPDLICAPQWSGDGMVAAVMAAKAAGINGMFGAKALIDLDTGTGGARGYADAVAQKKSGSLVDKNQIVCWPMVKNGALLFHMSTRLAGVMAEVDTGNGGCPYESPSNKNLRCDAVVLEDGTAVSLTLAQANVLNANGIMTALNFMGGWVCWGNYTACYPTSSDCKDYFIPVSRMFDWVGNTLIRTFWGVLDKPMRRLLIDTVVDTCNIWLNGLVGSGYLLGARVELRESENPTTSLMAGIIRLHICMTPPGPAQELDFTLEYNADYVTSALQS